MKTNPSKSAVSAHVKFALSLHAAYTAIGASVRPVKLAPSMVKKRESILKQINQLQNKLDTQWYSDCPELAKEHNSIYLNERWAKEAAKGLD